MKIIKQKTSDLTVCYGVITKTKQFRLSVMILFYEATLELERRGYKVALEWIDEISSPSKTTAPVLSNVLQPNSSTLPVSTSNDNVMVDSGIDLFVENSSNFFAKPTDNIDLSESPKSINENIPIPTEILLKSDNDSSQSSSDLMMFGKRKSSIDNFDQQFPKREKTEIKEELP